MKRKFVVAAVFALLLSIGSSINAEAGRWGHYRGGGWYRPRPYRVFVAPPLPPPVVVVGPRWGYRPHYRAYGYRPYYRHSYGYRRW